MRAEDGRTDAAVSSVLYRRCYVVGYRTITGVPIWTRLQRSIPADCHVMELELILRAAFFASIDRAQQRRTPNRGLNSRLVAVAVRSGLASARQRPHASVGRILEQ
jgi:hypothetical protein